MHPGAIVGGKYRLDRLIGEGAMGAVWAAIHRETGQPVAVKVVSGPEVLADELCNRLVREARACSLIRHPNVVSVVDVGQLPGGAPFMVMQLLQGETLDVRLKRDGKLAAVEAARIGAQVGRALAAAHAAAIVHRDLKPANIFLHVEHGASQSVVKVLDFGVSKILSERAGGGSDARATATGHAMGSPAYMSPEQAKSANKVDSRADIWSLGVVLFEMFAGAMPFPGETAYAVIGEVLHGPIPKLRDVVPALDPRLADLVERCIVRDVQKRIASAEEVVRVLESFLRDQQSGPMSSPNEKTEPLGSSRLRAAVLGSMRLGSVPDLDGPTPARVPPAEPKVPPPEPSRPEPPRASDRAVVTPASNARPAPNMGAASVESFARAPTARAFPQLAIAPPQASAPVPAPTLVSSREGTSAQAAPSPSVAAATPSAGASALAALSPSNAASAPAPARSAPHTIALTGPQPALGNTGPQQALGNTGPQAAIGNTGPQQAIGNTGPQRALGNTGPQAALGNTGPQAAIGNTGPQQAIGNTGSHGVLGNPAAAHSLSAPRSAAIPAAPPSSPHALGARSSTAPILLVQPGAPRPAPVSMRRWIGIGAAIGVTAVSLVVAILVVLGGKPGAEASSGAAGSASSTPASATSSAPANDAPIPSPSVTTSAAPAPSEAPSAPTASASTSTTAPATAKPPTTPTGSGKRPGKPKPPRGGSFPTNPG